jgi:nitroreductase
MEFIELAKNRYSSRKYLNKNIEKEKIYKVLEAGRIAPSAVNFQPWHFIIIEDEANRKKLWETYKREWIREAPVYIIICGDHKKSWKRKNDGKDHCDIDIAIAADHITLQATELGLATCWVCNFDKEKCSKILELPENIEPIVIFPLGYPADKVDVNRHNEQRMNINEVVSWEVFASNK